jgi:transcriptional regulator with XRE-family HTH domain
MIKFKINKITLESDNIGQRLRQARKNQNIKLEQATKELNINLKYLKALENGHFEKLPAGIYRKKFLHEYAQFLKLNPDEFVDIFNNQTEDKIEQSQKNLFSKKVPSFSYFLTFPKIIRNTIIIITALVCITYLGYCLVEIISPPELLIISPKENFITNKKNVDIHGQTEAEAEVTINDEAVFIDANGNFEKKINLKDGLNTISIVAQKKYSRKNNIIRNIVVRNQN